MVDASKRGGQPTKNGAKPKNNEIVVLDDLNLEADLISSN